LPADHSQQAMDDGRGVHLDVAQSRVRIQVPTWLGRVGVDRIRRAVSAGRRSQCGPRCGWQRADRPGPRRGGPGTCPR